MGLLSLAIWTPIAFGVVLLVSVSLSGLAARTVLSTARLFLVAGALLGPGGVGVVDYSADDAIVAVLADIALFTVLFTDGQRASVPALREGWRLPDSYEGYGFLSYDCQPLATRHVEAAEVLRFRDRAWQTYFDNPAYLGLVARTFGAAQRGNVEAMAKIPLRRRLLGD